jgi:two-component system, OmpR family, sensor histidine kinase KdpD
MRVVPLSNRSVWLFCAKVVGTLGIVAGVTGACLYAGVNATTTGFAYVIAVLLIATAWGIAEAVVASVVGMLCFNFYFFQPVKTLTVADPQNWLALFAFLVTAIVASELSARAKRQAKASMHRQRELERLYRLGRVILLDQGDAALPQRLAQNIADQFEVPAVTLYDGASGRQYKAGPHDLVIPESILATALSGDIGARTDDLDSRIALIRLGKQPVGVLAIRGDVSDTSVDAISNLVAIGLERARARAAETRAEAARQSEELKSTLLDAIAHEFKTPLTSIKAAATTVLSGNGLGGEQRELLTIVDEETDRLNNLVTDAIQTLRIESGKSELNRSTVEFTELIAGVIGQMRLRLEDRPVDVRVDGRVPPLSLDSDLIRLALRQLIENAIKYSPAGSPIRIGADQLEGNVALWVADDGPGVASSEMARVFERFYRGDAVRHTVPGSGLGLSVVRDIARAHGGDAMAVPSPQGSLFQLVIPVSENQADDFSTNSSG